MIGSLDGTLGRVLMNRSVVGTLRNFTLGIREDSASPYSAGGENPRRCRSSYAWMMRSSSATLADATSRVVEIFYVAAYSAQHRTTKILKNLMRVIRYDSCNDHGEGGACFLERHDAYKIKSH